MLCTKRQRQLANWQATARWRKGCDLTLCLVALVFAVAAAALAIHLGGWALEGYRALRDPAASTSVSALTADAPVPTLISWIIGWIMVVVQFMFAIAAGLLAALMGLASLQQAPLLQDRHWCELLFRVNTKKQLRAWAVSLKYFRFVRGTGGGMCEVGDCLKLKLWAGSHEDIPRILIAIGQFMEPPPKAAEGNELAPTTMTAGSAVRGLLQCDSSTPDWLTLSVADAQNAWDVTQSAVEFALDIEAVLAPFASLVFDPPQNDRHCICPKYYPSFWGPPGQISTGVASRRRKRRKKLQGGLIKRSWRALMARIGRT